MKSNKNFQKSKKSGYVSVEKETRIKKVGAKKKLKNFKKEIFDEIDELEELNLFGNKTGFLETNNPE